MEEELFPKYTNASITSYCVIYCEKWPLMTVVKIQDASRETDVFEMNVTEQVEGVEAWVGGSETRQAMPFQLTSCCSG